MLYTQRHKKAGQRRSTSTENVMVVFASPSCPAPTGHLLARRSTAWTFGPPGGPLAARLGKISCRWPSYRPAGATFPLQTVPVEGPSLMRRAGESPSISTTIPISGGCHPFVFGMAQKINAPQVCCLATRLRGSLGSTVQK